MPSLDSRTMTRLAEQKYATAKRTASPPPAFPSPPGARPGPIIGAHRQAPAPPPPPDPSGIIEPLCQAIAGAIDQWRLQAHFTGVVIHGPAASGGLLQGPDLESLVQAQLKMKGPNALLQDYGATVARALGQAWGRWTASVRVGGLPWYPSFAAWPGPMAPPTPNTPTPLAACTSDAALLKGDALQRALRQARQPPDPVAEPLFQSVAQAFETVFTQWLTAQMVTNVMGQGPVPGFAPPHHPVGPVAGGSIIPAPPHLAS